MIEPNNSPEKNPEFDLIPTQYILVPNQRPSWTKQISTQLESDVSIQLNHNDYLVPNGKCNDIEMKPLMANGKTKNEISKV